VIGNCPVLSANQGPIAPELGRPLNQGQTITREEILARLNDPSLCSSTSCRKRRLRTGISLARSTCRCLKSKPRHASFFPMSQGRACHLLWWSHLTFGQTGGRSARGHGYKNIRYYIGGMADWAEKGGR